MMNSLSYFANKLKNLPVFLVFLFVLTSPVHAQIAGLDFPGSAAVSSTMRFKFADPHLNGLPIYGPNGNGVTYIWRAYPRRQSGYFTAFFLGNDDGAGNLSTFLWTPTGGADSYYGFHPYPQPPPGGSSHKWEISIEQNDFLAQQSSIEFLHIFSG